MDIEPVFAAQVFSAEARRQSCSNRGIGSSGPRRQGIRRGFNKLLARNLP